MQHHYSIRFAAMFMTGLVYRLPRISHLNLPFISTFRPRHGRHSVDLLHATISSSVAASD